jgi:hypothetical protein
MDICAVVEVFSSSSRDSGKVTDEAFDIAE